MLANAPQDSWNSEQVLSARWISSASLLLSLAWTRPEQSREQLKRHCSVEQFIDRLMLRRRLSAQLTRTSAHALLESRLQAVQRFVVADLSNWYLDVIKDRLYVSAADSFDRRAAQTVLHSLVQARHPLSSPDLYTPCLPLDPHCTFSPIEPSLPCPGCPGFPAYAVLKGAMPKFT